MDPETGSALYYDNQQDENGNYTKNKVTDPGQASPIPLKDITPSISGGFMNTFNYNSLTCHSIYLIVSVVIRMIMHPTFCKMMVIQ